MILYFCQFGKVSKETSDWGYFGSLFGGLMGVGVSIISVYFVYKAYIHQVNATKQQVELTAKSEFENHLFKMLDYQREIYRNCQNIQLSEDEKTLFSNEIVDNPVVQDSIEEYEKNLYIDRTVIAMVKAVNYCIINLTCNEGNYNFKKIVEETDEAIREKMSIQYDFVMAKSNHAMNHYFHHLYEILHFLDDSELIEKEQKNNYVNLLKSQMSNSELYLSMIYGLTIHGKDLYTLMDKYNFLENLIFYNRINNNLLHDRLDFIYDMPLISLILSKSYYSLNHINFIKNLSKRKRIALSNGIWIYAIEEGNWLITDKLDVVYMNNKGAELCVYRKNNKDEMIHYLEEKTWFNDERVNFDKCCEKALKGAIGNLDIEIVK